MIESEITDIPQLEEENRILTADFTKQEVYDAIVQMEKIKLHGQMGFYPNTTKKFRRS
jgi:hypothetical protein